MNKNIILDTGTDAIICNACGRRIEPEEPKIVIAFLYAEGEQEYRVFHRACLEDPER